MSCAGAADELPAGSRAGAAGLEDETSELGMVDVDETVGPGDSGFLNMESGKVGADTEEPEDGNSSSSPCPRMGKIGPPLDELAASG